MSKKGPKPKNLIKAITEGLLGYIIYLSRSGMQEAYSEYLLYDPIIRIAKDKWDIKSEFCVDLKKSTGDKLRIDFLFKSSFDPLNVVGLEVKYLKKDDMPNLENDYNKLKSLHNFVKYNSLKMFILIAGQLSEDKANEIHVHNDTILESDDIYSCRFFENQFHKKYGVAVFEIT